MRLNVARPLFDVRPHRRVFTDANTRTGNGAQDRGVSLEDVESYSVVKRRRTRSNTPQTAAPTHARMQNAGIEAIDHFTIKRTIELNGMSKSLMLTDRLRSRPPSTSGGSTVAAM